MTEAEVAQLRERAMSVPISSALGLTLVAIERGMCRLAMTRDPRYDGIFLSLHGGLMMTLADSAGAFALLSVVDPGEAVTTTEMNIRFLAPVHDRVTATAQVLKVGKTLCPLVTELHDDTGRLVAHAGMTYMRVRRDSASLDPTRGQGGTR